MSQKDDVIQKPHMNGTNDFNLSIYLVSESTANKKA